jgi:hypothetical protein
MTISRSGDFNFRDIASFGVQVGHKFCYGREIGGLVGPRNPCSNGVGGRVGQKAPHRQVIEGWVGPRADRTAVVGQYILGFE